MRLETISLLEDIREAGALIASFVAGKSFEDFRRDALLRSGLERQLEIAGEALRCLHREDRGIAAGLENYQRFMLYRNTLAHDYRAADDRLTWDAAAVRLPRLIEQVTALIASSEKGSESGPNAI